MSTFYVCWCGNTADNHNYRHDFEKRVKVNRTVTDGYENFVIDASDYCVQTKTICSIPQCVYGQLIHESTVVPHAFSPTVKEFRDIKLTLPDDAKCKVNGCVTLGEHESVHTHHFETRVKIINREEKDNIFIVSGKDEDIKIIWE